LRILGESFTHLLPTRPSEKGGPADALGALRPLHAALNPSDPSVEEGWRRNDVWGLLLVPYALLLRGGGSDPHGSPRSSPRGGAGGPSVGGTNVTEVYTKCLMVASQLKSLTFARLSLLPSLAGGANDDDGAAVGSSPTSDFYLSAASDMLASYVDALAASGSLPITRSEWYDEEVNIAKVRFSPSGKLIRVPILITIHSTL